MHQGHHATVIHMAAALSDVRAAVTVSATLLGSGICNPTLGHSVTQWPSRCQHLQKTLPLTARRATFLSTLRVFSPSCRLRCSMGWGVEIGSPLQPPLAPPLVRLFDAGRGGEVIPTPSEFRAQGSKRHRSYGPSVINTYRC